MIIPIIIVLAGIFVYFIFIRKSNPLPETVIAKRGTVTEIVSVTGNVKPTEEVELAFEKSGKVSYANVEVGTLVKAGQVLVGLDNSDIRAQLDGAKADLRAEEAKLSEMEKGTTPENIAVYETKLSNAQTSLEDAKGNLIDNLQDAYTKSDDAIRNKVDQYFSNPRGSSPALVFTASDALQVEDMRVTIEYILVSWKSSLDKLNISSELDSYISSANSNLDQIKSFLEKNALMLNSLTASANLSQTSIDTYRSAVSTARTNVNTAITNLQTAEETLSSAESSVSLAEKNLALEKAGSTAEQIAAQVAKIEKAKANIENYQAQLAKTILISPIKGIVTKQDAKVGEIVSANTAVVSVISAAEFEIEANVAEADIAKIKVGDKADLTLDAYGGGVIFTAHVQK